MSRRLKDEGNIKSANKTGEIRKESMKVENSERLLIF